MRCSKCGVDNPDDLTKCLACGTALTSPPATALEIEVYDVARRPEPEPSAFEKALAATRASETRAAEDAPPADIEGAEIIRDEVARGYEIRRRRLNYRTVRPRHIVIFAAAVGAVALAVIFGVRWSVARMPKYEYARVANADGTARALALAATLEATRLDAAAGYAGPTAALTVVGGEGRVLVDGAYVADAPSEGIKLPVGAHHVIVKQGKDLVLDEEIVMREGERYKFELGAATALSAPPAGAPGG